MSVFAIILSIILVAVCILLNIIILLQKDRASGFTSALGGGGGTDSYYGKNKSRSMEGTLEKYTKIGAAVFMVVAFILYLVMKTQ